MSDDEFLSDVDSGGKGPNMPPGTRVVFMPDRDTGQRRQEAMNWAAFWRGFRRGFCKPWTVITDRSKSNPGVEHG